MLRKFLERQADAPKASAFLAKFDQETENHLLQTDASDKAIGASLSQVDANGADYPVVYLSRKLLPREMAYSTVEKECLALVWSDQVLRPYLYSRSFDVYTDHKLLPWLKQAKDKNV